MALDEPNTQDSVLEEGGFTFCVDKTLLDHIKGVTMFLSEAGFEVRPHEELPSYGNSGGGCGCGSSCGSGGGSEGGCGSGGGCCSQ